MSMLSDLEPGLSGLEQLRALIAAGREMPMHQTLGIALVSVEVGNVVLEALPGPEHLNPAGIVHGGYAATILDTACGCAVLSAVGPDTGFTTLELKISYLRPVTPRTGTIRAIGTLLTLGRRAAFSEAKLLDADGKLLATATSTLLVMTLTPPKE